MLCTKKAVYCSLSSNQIAQEKHHQHKLRIMLTASASEVFCTNRWQEKHHQQKLHGVKTVLGNSRSRMQQTNAGSTRARSEVRVCALVQAAIGCCISKEKTTVSSILYSLLLQPALGPTAQLALHSMVGSC